MYQAVICTISSGRVQRMTFNTWEAAWECADAWFAKNTKNRTYTVSVEHVAPTVTVKKQQQGRSAGM